MLEAAALQVPQERPPRGRGDQQSSHDGGGGVRFYRVLSANVPGIGQCITQIERDGDRVVFRPDTTSWFEVPLDYAAARCLLDERL